MAVSIPLHLYSPPLLRLFLLRFLRSSSSFILAGNNHASATPCTHPQCIHCYSKWHLHIDMTAFRQNI